MILLWQNKLYEEQICCLERLEENKMLKEKKIHYCWEKKSIYNIEDLISKYIVGDKGTNSCKVL